MPVYSVVIDYNTVHGEPLSPCELVLTENGLKAFLVGMFSPPGVVPDLGANVSHVSVTTLYGDASALENIQQRLLK
jgi:hypothetical protein